MKGNRTNPVRTRSPLRWLIIMVMAIVLIFVIGFDPLGQWLGEQAVHIIVLTIIIALWLYIVYLNTHNN